MTNLFCTMCEYTATNKSNLNKHFKTKKHAKKSTLDGSSTAKPQPDHTKKNQYINQNNDEILYDNNSNVTNDAKTLTCQYCGEIFSRLDTLHRHKKKCTDVEVYRQKERVRKQMEENIKQKNDEFKNKAKLKEKVYKNQIKSLENEIKHHQKENEHYKRETEYYKIMLNEAGKMMNKSVQALTYIATNYRDAPNITTIQPDDALKLIMDKPNDREIVNTIIFKFENKKLVAYIGNMIVDIYKKNNPNEQSVWNSDSSRLTYLIKEILDDSGQTDLESHWKIDKKGLKTKEYLIDPLLEKIKKMLLDYQIVSLKRMHNKTFKNLSDVDDVSTDFDEEILDDPIKSTSELIEIINKGSLSNKILKHISAGLYFEKK